MYERFIDRNGNCVLPDSTRYIVEEGFGWCENLKSITIPDSVTDIGEYAFEYCTNLKSIIIPNSVTHIGSGAFCFCSNLKSITIPNSVTKIREDMFHGCTNLKSIIIPNSVTEIWGGVFFGCDNLTSIDIPSSVTYIDDEAFVNCVNLKSITIPNNLVDDVIDELPDDCLINGKPKRSYIKNNFRRNSMRRFIGSARSVNVMTLLDKWSSGRSDVGVELIGDATEIRFEGILKSVVNAPDAIIAEIKTTDGSWCTIALDKTSISATNNTIKGETLEGMAFTLERF